MKNHALILTLAFAFILPVSQTHAQKEAKKPANVESKKAEPAAEKKKPAAVSESDQALQDAASKEAAKLTPTQNAKLLELLNKGDSKALQVFDGVAEGKAENIIKKRPYTKVEDVVKVDGIGEGTFANMVAWAKGAKAPEKKEEKKEEKPEAKKEEKKPEPKKPEGKKPEATKKAPK